MVQTITNTKKKIWYLKFRVKFQDKFWILPSPRAKKKLKSVFHYLINNDDAQAIHFYRQLEKEYKDILN